jgi:hypothetical protein
MSWCCSDQSLDNTCANCRRLPILFVYLHCRFDIVVSVAFPLRLASCTTLHSLLPPPHELPLWLITVGIAQCCFSSFLAFFSGSPRSISATWRSLSHSFSRYLYLLLLFLICRSNSSGDAVNVCAQRSWARAGSRKTGRKSERERER